MSDGASRFTGGIDRRRFIGTSSAAGASLAGGPVRRAGADENGIRNILFLFVDQQRQGSLGCYGDPVVETPNIDRLARTGIRFENAFTPTPLCSPARMALQTGLWPHNTRVMFNTGRGGKSGGVDDPDPPVPFLGDHLSRRNWNLANVGKWHVGSERNKPSAHGYEGVYYTDYGLPSGLYSPPHEHYFDYLKGLGLDGFRLLTEKRDPTGRKLYAGRQAGPPEASIPHYLAGMTADYIEKYSRDDRPFYVSCNFWGPHEPYCIPEPYFSMYRDADVEIWPSFDCDLSDKPDAIRRYGDYWRTGWFTEAALRDLIREYYGYITLIDEQIGRILDALERSGELERTLIVYSADHGSTAGAYRMWAKGFGMYDCMTRIPLVVSHPSIRPGVSEAFVTLLDLMPTFLDLAGGRRPERGDGRSLMPVLDGSAAAVRDDHIVTETFGHVVPFWQRMVRTPGTKFIFNPTDVDEFYDIGADPHETRNLIGTVDRRTLARHGEILLEWMKETGDDMLFWTESLLYDLVRG